MCKAQVNSSPPTNQHPTFYRPDVLPVSQPTVSKHWRATENDDNWEYIYIYIYIFIYIYIYQRDICLVVKSTLAGGPSLTTIISNTQYKPDRKVMVQLFSNYSLRCWKYLGVVLHVATLASVGRTTSQRPRSSSWPPDYWRLRSHETVLSLWLASPCLVRRAATDPFAAQPRHVLDYS